MNQEAQDAYDEAVRIIESARRNHTAELKMGPMGLSHLPPEIGDLTSLTVLDLSNNQLTSLPAEIGKLTSLTELDLSNNKLTTLSAEIGNLTSLTKLSLYDNQLTALPAEIGKLTSLNWLSLSNNQLTALPVEIGKLTSLTGLYLTQNQLTSLPAEIGKLTSLTELYLFSNQLTALPSEIGKLTSLTKLYLFSNQLTALPVEIWNLTALTELYLFSNQLTALPADIWKLTSLTILDLSSNQLTALPADIWKLTSLTGLYLTQNQLTSLPAEIGKLTSLTTLNLDSNQLTAVPAEIGRLTSLTVLSLGSNQLSSLPVEIRMLPSLTELYLQENPALGIPDSQLGASYHDVILNGAKPERPADILGFYFLRLEAGTEGNLHAVNEVKLMLVGRGEAGKTSMRRFFKGEAHNTKEKETPGIGLDSFPLRMDQSDITVRLWDFAGQEITHALHHFFLSDACVYVLVVDPRSDTEEEDAKYWLGLLERYAKGAPVLIAMNRQDARQGGYDLPQRELLKAFPSVKGFQATNCETRAGCEELLAKVRAVVRGLDPTEPPHLQIPESWLEIMRACEVHGKANKPLMSLGEFREVCTKHGESVQAEQERLARMLHKLGAVLHFVDEPRLRDTAVLDPHWVTDGVYRLLRHKDGPGSDGILTISDALAALPGRDEKEARYLFRLMERFEMCIPLDEDGDKPASRWLVPGALEKFQPEGLGEDWEDPGGVRMRYVYDPLPVGVIPRFIVTTQHLSDGQPRWRSGVVVREGRAKALVRKGIRKNHVEVTAFGPEEERLRLIEIIRGNLERINLDLPDPKPKAEIEILDMPGVYRNLADMEAAEQQKVKVPMQSSRENVLIDPVPSLNLTSEEEPRTSERVPLRAFLSYSHRDKRAKGILQDNLVTLTRKKMLNTWQDGLIEPGTLWLEEINRNLDRMDVFIGLLTTAFLASDFIQKVELEAARKRLALKNRKFIFVLILVDDISLLGLDLAQYQILKPGGKAVTQHASVKAGFDVAQKELEMLILAEQENRKESPYDEMHWAVRDGGEQ